MTKEVFFCQTGTHGTEDSGLLIMWYMLFVSILYYYITTSVRGMQYILNMAVNAKISEGLVHKLSFECFRIWPLVLWPLWEDFEKLAFAEEYL